MHDPHTHNPDGTPKLTRDALRIVTEVGFYPLSRQPAGFEHLEVSLGIGSALLDPPHISVPMVVYAIDRGQLTLLIDGLIELRDGLH